MALSARGRAFPCLYETVPLDVVDKLLLVCKMSLPHRAVVNRQLTIPPLSWGCVGLADSEGRESLDWEAPKDMATITLTLALIMTLGTVFITGVVASRYGESLSLED